MVCQYCGEVVQWQGRLTNLTHTLCLKCGAINAQMVEGNEDTENEDEKLIEAIEARRKGAEAMSSEWTAEHIKSDLESMGMKVNFEHDGAYSVFADGELLDYCDDLEDLIETYRWINNRE